MSTGANGLTVGGMTVARTHLDIAAERPIDAEQARGIADESRLDGLLAAARGRRDRAYGRIVTWSPKAFLPLTNLCPNRCDYCTFRRSPGDPGVWTMARDEVLETLDEAARFGCTEALFCLGDRPERAFSSYRGELETAGFADTVDFLVWAAEAALERALLPHTNAGVLDRESVARLRAWNASLGLMLESTSERLCGVGGPHHRAPDKGPEDRLRCVAEVGALRVPLTTGLLVGIGETRDERIDTIAAIGELHASSGHVQEVIVQGFRPAAGTPMASVPAPAGAVLSETIALARLMLPDEVSIQSPPNLSPDAVLDIVSAGANDLGGISPLTPDYVNPDWPWPHIAELAVCLSGAGFELAPRLPVYERFVVEDGWLAPAVSDRLSAARRRWTPTAAVGPSSGAAPSRQQTFA